MKEKHVVKRMLSFILAFLMFATTIPGACMEVFANTISGQIDVKSDKTFYLHATKIYGRTGNLIDDYYKPHALENITNDPDYTFMEVKTVSNSSNDDVYSSNCVPIYRISRKGGYTNVQTTVNSSSVLNYNVNDINNFVSEMNKAYGKTVLDSKKAKMIYYVLQNGLKQFENKSYYNERLYYLATQALIWEIAEGKRTGWGNDAISTEYGQPFPDNFNSDTYQTNYGKYYSPNIAKQTRAGLSSSYSKSTNGTPYPYYWHDWYYTVKKYCFDRPYCNDNNEKNSPYPDYYGQILRACQLQSAAGNSSNWAQGMVNDDYTMNYVESDNKYETTVSIKDNYKNIISDKTGAYFDFSKLVVPIRAYSSYTRTDGNPGKGYNNSYFIQHGSSYLSEVSYYTVNIDTDSQGKYYHVNVKNFPDDNGDRVGTFQLSAGTVQNNKITILGKTVNGKYYYISYRLKSSPDTVRHAYLKVGSKTTQHPKSRNTYSSDTLQLATYDDGTLIYPQPLYSVTYSNSEKKIYIKTNNALTPATDFIWHCNGVPSKYYNQTFAFKGNPSASTAAEKGIQGFASGGNGVNGVVTFKVSPKSNQKLTVKVQIENATNADTEALKKLGDTIWDKNISDNYTVKKQMISLKGHMFYGDESVTGTDSDSKKYLSNYIKKLNAATGKQYEVSKWTRLNGEEITFNSNGTSSTTYKNGGTVYIVLKEKTTVTDYFYCNGKKIGSISGYPGSKYNMPDIFKHLDCDYYDGKNGYQFAYWTLKGWGTAPVFSKDTEINEENKMYPGASNTFGTKSSSYYAHYEATDNRKVTFICGLDNSIVDAFQNKPGTSYKAPDGAAHLSKCEIPDTIEINGITYNKDDIKLTFAYWDKDSTSILAKDKIPDDAITPDNYNQTIPTESAVYYAKYKVEAKKTVEFKCSVCGEIVYSVNEYDGTEVNTPDKVNYVTDDGSATTTSLLDNHVCPGQITINGKNADVTSLNKEFKCYNQNEDIFNFDNALSGSVVTVPTGLLTDKNQVTTYYIHYNFKTGVTVTSHLQNEEYYIEKAEAVESTDMVSETAENLQEILEDSKGYTTERDTKKEAQEILDNWKQDISDRKWSSNIEWNKNINWDGTGVNNPAFSYKVLDNKYSDQYYVEYVSNDKEPFDNKIVIHNTSDKFDIKYITVKNKTGEIQTIDNSIDENGKIKTDITINCPAGKYIDKKDEIGSGKDSQSIAELKEIVGIDSIDDLQIDVYFDVPKTDFKVTINYIGLFNSDYKGITFSQNSTTGEYELSGIPTTINSEELTCKVLDGFVFQNVSDTDSGEQYLKDSITYYQTQMPFSDYIQTHLPGNEKIYKLDMSSDNPLSGTDLDGVIYTDEDISIDLYYTLPAPGNIKLTLTYDPEDAKKVIEEMGEKEGVKYIENILTRKGAVSESEYGRIEMYRLYDEKNNVYIPDSSIDYDTFLNERDYTSVYRYPGLSMSAVSEKVYCDSNNVAAGKRLTTTSLYYCETCKKFYSGYSWNIVNWKHSGTAYVLNGTEYVETSDFNSDCRFKWSSIKATSVYAIETPDETKLYSTAYQYDGNDTWTCENGHENNIKSRTCEYYDVKLPDVFTSTYTYQASTSDMQKYFFFAVNTQNCTDYYYENEIASSEVPYIGGDINYELVVSRGGVTKLKVGETSNNKFLPAENSSLIVSKDPYAVNQTIQCSNCGETVKIDENSKNIVCPNCEHEFNFADDGIEQATTNNDGEIRFRTPANASKHYYVSFPGSVVTINGEEKKTTDYYKYYNSDLSRSEYTNFVSDNVQKYLSKNGVVINTSNTNNVQTARDRAVIMFAKQEINVHYKLDNYVQGPVSSFGPVYVGMQVYKVDEANGETLIDDIYLEACDMETLDFAYVPGTNGQYKFIPYFYTYKETGYNKGSYVPSDKVVKIKTGSDYYYKFLEYGLALRSFTGLDEYPILSLAVTDDKYNVTGEYSTTVDYKGEKEDIYFRCLSYDSSYDINYSFYCTSKNIKFSKINSTDNTSLHLLREADLQLKVYDENKNLIDKININEIKSNYSSTYANFSYNTPDTDASVFDKDKGYVYYEHNGYLYLIEYSKYYAELFFKIVNLDITQTDETLYVTLEAQNPKSDLYNSSNFKGYQNYLTITNSYDITELGGASKITDYEQLIEYPTVWDYDSNVSQLMQANASNGDTPINNITNVVRIDNKTTVYNKLENENGDVLLYNKDLTNNLSFPAYENRDLTVDELISDTGISKMASQMKSKKMGALWFEYYSYDKYDFKNATLTKDLPLTSGKSATLVEDGLEYGDSDGVNFVDINGHKCILVDYSSDTLEEDLKQALKQITVKCQTDYPGVLKMCLTTPKYAVVTQKINMRTVFRCVGGMDNKERNWMKLIENADLNTGLFYNTSGTEYLDLQDLLNSLNTEQKTFFDENTINKFTSFNHSSNFYSVNNGKFEVDREFYSFVGSTFISGKLTKEINNYIDPDKKVYVESISGSFETYSLVLKYKINLDKSDLQDTSTFTSITSFDNKELEYDKDFPKLRNSDLFEAKMEKDSTGNITLDKLYSDTSGDTSSLTLVNDIQTKYVYINIVLDKDIDYSNGFINSTYGCPRPTVTDNELGGKTLTFKWPVQSFKEFIEKNGCPPMLIQLPNDGEYILTDSDNQQLNALYVDYKNESDEEKIEKYSNGVDSANGIFMEYNYYDEGSEDNCWCVSSQYVYKDTTVYVTKKTTNHSIMTSITEGAGTITAPMTEVSTGSNKVIGFNVNDGYYIDSVIVDGATLTQEEISALKNRTTASDGIEYEYSYLFENVKENHDIKVICKAYNTIVTNITNGVITPSMYDVKTGENKTITFTPNDGYYVSEVIIDNDEVNKITVSKAYSSEHNNEITYKNGQWTFSNITGNHSVSVVCEQKPTMTFISYFADRDGNESLSTGIFDRFSYDSGVEPYIDYDKSTKDKLVLSVYPEDAPALYYNGTDSGYYITKIESVTRDGTYKVTDYSNPDNLTLDGTNTYYNQPKYLAAGYRFPVEKTNRKYIIHWDKIYVDIAAVNTRISKSDLAQSGYDCLLEYDANDYVRPDSNGGYNEFHKLYTTGVRHESFYLYGVPYKYAYLSKVTSNGESTTLSNVAQKNGTNRKFVDLTGKEINPDYNYSFTAESHLLSLKSTIDNNSTVSIESDALDPMTANETIALNIYSVLGVKYGSSPKLKINLQDGYEIASISVNGSDVPLDNIMYENDQPYYIVNNMTSDTQVDIKTKSTPLYDVETWISNGTITESSYNINANETSSKLVTFKPAKGYEITGIRITRIVDGVEKTYSVDDVSNYNIGGDYTVNFDWDNWKETYKKQQYKIQVTCEEENHAKLIVYLHKDAVGVSTRSPLLGTYDKNEKQFWLQISTRFADESEILENKNSSGYYNSDDFPYYMIYYFQDRAINNGNTSLTLSENSVESSQYQKYEYCFEHRIVNGVVISDDSSNHISSCKFEKDQDGIWITQEAGCYIQSRPKDGIKVEFVEPNKEYVSGEQTIATFKVTNDTDEDLVDLGAKVKLMVANDYGNGGVELVSGDTMITHDSERLEDVFQDSEINTTVSVPAHGSNIFYVKFMVPDFKLRGWSMKNFRGIVPSAEIFNDTGIYAKTKNTELYDFKYIKGFETLVGFLKDGSWVNVLEYSDDYTERTIGNLNGGNNFTYSDSKNDKEYQNVAAWEQWNYDTKNGFVKHKYTAKLSYDSILLRPADLENNNYLRESRENGIDAVINPSQEYDESTNTWISKSGYSLQLSVPVNKVTVTDENGSTLDDFYSDIKATNLASSYEGNSQGAECYFPEYTFSANSGKYDALGKKIITSSGADKVVYPSDVYIGSTLTEYVFTHINDCSHIIPVWYPDDTDYKVQVKTTGAWTPAGALSYVGDSNSVLIEGSLFEDYRSRETSIY